MSLWSSENKCYTNHFILGTDGKKSLIICVKYCFIDRFLCHYGVVKTNMSHHIILGTDGKKVINYLCKLLFH